MKSFRILPILLLALFGSTQIFAQSDAQLDEWNQRRLLIQERQMYVLGGWSMANLAFSGIQYGRTTGETRSFHQMNLAWNAVNLGIAGLAYYGVQRDRKKTLSLTETLNAQSSTEKILLFNMGLDLAYMAGGMYLWERGNGALDPDDRNRYRGWGKSIIVQGGFLFTYDLIFLLIQNKHRNDGVMKYLERVQPVGLGLQINIPLNSM